jgi:transmembrane sensor
MNSEPNDDVAARWLIKRECGVWSPEHEVEFNAWLEASIARRIAYLRLYAAWDAAGRLKALSTADTLAAGTLPLRGMWDRGNPRPNGLSASGRAHPYASKRVGFRVGLVAAMLVVAALVTGIYTLSSGLLDGRRYSTATGAVDTVALNDGSKISLNSDSQVRVDLREGERRVALNKGEVFFDVAKDPTRPFVVRAGDKRVIAVGTQFSVRREGDEVKVVVSEGKVRVEQASMLSSLLAHSEPLHEALVSQGSVAQTRDHDIVVNPTTDDQMRKLLSWLKEYINFNDVSLSDAVAEFNRYNARKILIKDPTLARIRVSGNFRTTNTEAFLWLLQSRFSIVVQRGTNEITLKAR